MTIAEWFEKNRGDPEFIEACKSYVQSLELTVDPQELALGLYRVFWKSSGDSSLASVGMTRNGGRWLAPINWVAPTVDQTVWEDVLRVERIK